MKTKNAKAPGITRHKITKPAAVASLKLKTILATTDFSDESQAGVRYAIGLAEKLKASVALLHVVEPPSRMSGVETVVLSRADSEVAGLARAQLETLAKREGRRDVAVTCSVRGGKPFHEITTAAEQTSADLIVIATHGYTGVKHALLGSTAERVVRHASCPVLTVPIRATSKRTGKTSPLKLAKILVPIDFSDLSKDALPWAVFLAAQFGAEVILLHVVEKFPIDYLLGRELTSHAIVPLIKQAEAELEGMAASLREATGAKTSAVAREGRPYEEICDAAKTLGADLIALTTHGYTGLKHAWLGSTAERVVRNATCPVLVVRATQFRA